MFDEQNTLFQKVELLQNTLVARCTTDDLYTGDYEALRRELLSNPVLKNHLPPIVKKNRTLDQFWNFIKLEYSTYAERRSFLWKSFSGLLDQLEENTEHNADVEISLTIKDSGEDYIKDSWNKALDRRRSDPEGAITAARALIETVCKHILESSGIPYDEKWDLPKLYKKTASELNLSPDQHNEQVFKQILGGCQSVVNGLGELRNKYSDSHGQGRKQVKPSSRHAKIAVNLAGAMASFLLETFNELHSSDSGKDNL